MFTRRSSLFLSLNREKILTLLSSLFNVSSNILTYRILLSYFDLSSVGIVGIVNTITFLCILFFVGPLSHSVLRFFNEYLQINKQSVFFSTLLRVVINELKYFVFVALVVIILFYFLTDNSNALTVFLGFSISIFSALISTVVNFFESNRIRVVSLLVDLTLPWFKLLLIFLLISNFKKDLNLIFLAQLIAVLVYFSVACLVVIKFYRIQRGFETDENLLNRINIYVRPYKFWGMPYWLYQSSDKYFMAYFSNTHLLGYYTILYQFTYTPITILLSVVMKYLQPKIFSDNNLDQLNKSIIKYVIIYVLIILFSFLFSILFLNKIVSFLLGEIIIFDYLSIGLLIIASGMYGIADLFSIYFNLLLKNHLLIPLKIISSLFGLLSNFIFIYFFNYKGVVLSIFLYSLLVLTWTIINRNTLIQYNEKSNS